MNNNNLDQITMRSSKRKRTRLPMKFSNDTSISIGEVQVFMCQKMLANSRKRFKAGNIVRLAAMVAPTFGQLKLHHNFSFVGMSDVISSDIYNAYLTQKPVAFGNGLVQVPKQLPSVSLQILSSFALVGAKWTAYQVRDNHDDSASNTSLHRFYYDGGGAPDGYDGVSSIRWVGSDANSARNFALHIAGFSPSGMSDTDINNALYVGNDLWQKTASEVTLYGEGAAFDGYTHSCINLGRIFGWPDFDYWLPCANSEMPLFFVPRNDEQNEFIKGLSNYKPTLTNLEPVTYEDYDFLIRTRLPYGSGDDKVSVEFAVRLSDFGRRFFNTLNALGVGFDLQSEKPVDLTRFVALYLAYFNSFGITLYQGMETLHSRRLMASYESSYLWDWTSLIMRPSLDDAENYREFFCFLRDVANMWYTEEQDWLSAHSRQAVVSSSSGIVAEMNERGTPNVNGVININDGSQTDQFMNGTAVPVVDTRDANTGGHAFINSVLHSQLDSEVLMRLYKVTNRNTIAGRRIAELLKAQGLGQYVKQCRSTFIGHSSIDIDIFDVTATADGFNSKDDFSSVLGEYVGKGVGDGDSKWFSYETPEVGYIFDLAAVVPESGWTNGVDLTAFDVKSSQQYQPEFDGLGLEISPKSIVTGIQDSFGMNEAEQPSVNDESYGFIPRMTRYKVARNVMNGSYALHSVRKSFLAYNLDKVVNIGQRVLRADWRDNNSSQNYGFATESKLLSAARLPIASPVYRYLGRYPWMAQFMRIFANLGRDAFADNPYWYDDYDSGAGESENTWYLVRTDDPINIHNVYLMDYYAPVLPIEDSFETHEDGNNGPSDMSIGKS